MKSFFLILVIFVSAFSCSTLINRKSKSIKTEKMVLDRDEPEEVKPVAANWSFFMCNQPEAVYDHPLTILKELENELRALIAAPEIDWNSENSKITTVKFYKSTDFDWTRLQYPEPLIFTMRVSASTEALMNNFKTKYEEALSLKGLFHIMKFNSFQESAPKLFEEYFTKLVAQECENNRESDPYQAILLVNDLLYAMEFLNSLFFTRNFENGFLSFPKAFSGLTKSFVQRLIPVLNDVNMDPVDKFKIIEEILSEFYGILVSARTTDGLIIICFQRVFLLTIIHYLPRGQTYDPALFINLIRHFFNVVPFLDPDYTFVIYYQFCMHVFSKTLDENISLYRDGHYDKVPAIYFLEIMMTFGKFIFVETEKLDDFIKHLKTQIPHYGFNNDLKCIR